MKLTNLKAPTCSALLAILLAAALPASAGVTRGEPTLNDVKQDIMVEYLQDRCGAAFGEDRGVTPLDREDRITWLRCLWLRDSQARLSRGIRPDRTLTEWSARNGITENTPDARLSDAWFHPSVSVSFRPSVQHPPVPGK